MNKSPSWPTTTVDDIRSSYNNSNNSSSSSTEWIFVVTFFPRSIPKWRWSPRTTTTTTTECCLCTLRKYFQLRSGNELSFHSRRKSSLGRSRFGRAESVSEWHFPLSFALLVYKILFRTREFVLCRVKYVLKYIHNMYIHYLFMCWWNRLFLWWRRNHKSIFNWIRGKESILMYKTHTFIRNVSHPSVMLSGININEWPKLSGTCYRSTQKINASKECVTLHSFV